MKFYLSTNGSQTEPFSQAVGRAWCILILSFCMIATGIAGSPATGLVIYNEPPGTYVDALEFSTLTKNNIQYSTVVLPGGDAQHIPTSGIQAIVNYPPANVEAGTTEEDPTLFYLISWCLKASLFREIKSSWSSFRIFQITTNGQNLFPY